MPEIRVIDEFDGLIDAATFDAGTPFADAAMERWPEGWPGKTAIIYGTAGDPVDDMDAVTRPAKEGEVYTVALLPQGPAAFLGVAWYYWVLAAVSLAATFLMKPKVPSVSSTSYEWDDDTPQFFSAQSNKMRPGSRVPDVFGFIRVWPDLIANPYIRYRGDDQTVQELYVVSNGHCDVTDLKLHDESVSDMADSDFKVYHPGDVWPADVPIIRTNAYVGSIELIAPNEGASFGRTLTIDGFTITADIDEYFNGFGVGTGEWFSLSGGVDDDNRRPQRVVSVSTDGRVLTCQYNFAGPRETITDGTLSFRTIDRVHTTTHDITGSTGDPATIFLSDDLIGPPNRFDNPDGSPYVYYSADTVSQPNYSEYTGKWTFVDVSNPLNYTERSWRAKVYPHPLVGGSSRSNRLVAGPDDASSNEDFMNGNGGDSWAVTYSGSGVYDPALPSTGHLTSIFRVPGTVTKIISDFEFPQGLYYQRAGEVPSTRTVKVKIYWRAAGSTDPWSSETFTFTAKTRTPRRWTKSVDPGPSGEYEVYYERTTDFKTDTETRVYVDAVQLIGLHGRQDVSELKDDILNCTLIELNLSTQNVQQLTNQRSLNCMASRWLPDYRDVGDGSLRATSDIADAILYTLVDQSGYNLANIDLASLEAVQADLDAIDVHAGKFNAIVDQTMTTEDQVTAIASVGRIIVYRRASTFYFTRLKSGLLPRTLINGRNKLEPETRTMTFSEENDPDVVIMRFMDETDDYREGSVQWPEDTTPVFPEEQSLLGVTSPVQASRMAQYAYDRLINERDTISFQMTAEGALYGPGDIIAVTDHLDEALPVQGEVTAINGDVFTFDQTIPAGTWMARLRDRFGELYASGEIIITGAGPVQTMVAWAGAEMPADPAQVGLLYSFTAIADDSADLFYIVSVTPSREGMVTIEGMAYRDETYAADARVVASSLPPAIKRRPK